MKILHLNTNDNSGGAARAAYRLHQSLNKLSLDIRSEMLVLKKGTDDPKVHKLSDSLFHKARPLLATIPQKKYPNRENVPFSSAWVPFSGIVDKINEINPDIVHLHWVNGGLLRIEDLAKINKPIIWSLHDMWAFTGGCHIDLGCGKYKEECGACPVLKSNKEKDLSRKIFHRKFNTYSKIHNLTIVGLSKWLCNCAEKSGLFKGKNIVNLPNPIDTSIFNIVEKSIARQILSLDQSKKFILFGAMNATSNSNKGFNELKQSIRHLNNQDEKIELLIFGSSGDNNEEQDFLGLPANFLGRLHDDVTLKLIYNAADVVVVPSKQENLSNVIMESFSCGTPVVAFDIGGNSDMIEHNLNGYLAEPYSSEDLANGIEWILSVHESKNLSKASRDKVLANFESNVVAKKYLDLYKEVLTMKTL